ncbi:MAG: hypothetical protein U0836_09385 [Pirellulales bacterium]
MARGLTTAGILLALIGGYVIGQQPSPDKAADGQAISIRWKDTDYTMRGGEGELQFTRAADGQRGVLVLPPGAGRITEIRSAPWMLRGLAIAVETTAATADQRSYYWAVLWSPAQLQGPGRQNAPESPEARPLRVQPILENTEDYDLLDIRNSTSDSIYVALARHRREPGDVFDGYFFVHNCPSAIPGRLIPFRAPTAGATP